MAPLFNFKERCPSLAGLPDAPAVGDFSLFSNCAVPAAPPAAYICPTYALPPPAPTVDRFLYLAVTAVDPVTGACAWTEIVPDGLGGTAAGPRSGTIADGPAYEINGARPAPGPTAYPARQTGGTGTCAFSAAGATPASAGGGGGGGAFGPSGQAFIQLLAYDKTSRTYAWAQVGYTAGKGWAPSGASGSAATGDGAVNTSAAPAAPDGDTVHLATFAPSGKGALATASIAAPGPGPVTSLNIVFGGSGYVAPPAVAVRAAPGDAGAGAAATATLSDSGAVSALTLTSAGSGYAAAPLVTIAPPPPVPVFAAPDMGVLARTDDGGIPPGTSNTQPGKADVEIWFYSKTRNELVDSGVSITMYNMDTSSAVAANAYVQGKVCAGGVVFHDYELCPNGG